MRNNIYLILIFIVLFYSCTERPENVHNWKLPEDFRPSDEATEEDKEAKEEFFEKLYYAPDGVDVTAIRHENWKRNYEQIQQRRTQAHLRTTTTFADGYFEGDWHERGPNNEAGDMREIDFLPETEELYAISSIGHLWKGTLAGGDWSLLNDKIRMGTNLLEVIPNGDNNRVFAIHGTGQDNKIIRYSDDDGQTWVKGTGFSFYDHWGSPQELYVLSDQNTLYYLVHTWSADPWGQLFQLYVSTNKGVDFTKVWQSSVGYRSREIALWKPHDSDQMYLVDNESQVLTTINHDFVSKAPVFSSSVSYSSQNIGRGEINLTGRFNPTASTYELFLYRRGSKEIYSSVNGSTWTYLSTSTESVWRKGWLANPNNQHLYIGGFQLNKSLDLSTWTEQYLNWWVYYSTNKDFMHVDIMNLDYFEKADGSPFIIILNHAGVHVTYDNFATTKNLGLSSLNVTTLYDQTTASDGYLYCGAQDKGTFFYEGNSAANLNILSTTNKTTGDGMVGSFFNSDQSVYCMIQNGSFATFPDRNSSTHTWYDIPGTHKSGWINPMVATPDFTDNKAYMAGGNLNGGSGCYLIEMDVDISNGLQFKPTQFNYNFRANSRNKTSSIKAIGVTQADHQRIYVATEDATFFYSTDKGDTWTRSNAQLPSQSMIPWEITASSSDANKVFICGTGFVENTGVFMSENGGQSFTPLVGDMPRSVFYEVSLSDDERILFAATSAGPYAYVFEQAKWYSLVDENTPVVDYNTVDNIGDGIIRFGTYGRGIWDFKILSTSTVPTFELQAVAQQDNAVLVTLSTINEQEVQTYEWQHSTDNSNFVTLATINSEGKQSNNYQHLHANPVSGDNYYRVKINKTAQTIEYTAIQHVFVDIPTALDPAELMEFNFNVFPNPILSGTELSIDTKFESAYSITFFDLKGQRIYTHINLKGNQKLIPKLPQGQYVYRISAEGTSKSGKLIVQ